jgi:hypothetical protein
MRLCEIKEHRKVYLDMDGVLVDCVKAASKFNNIEVQDFIDAGYHNKYWENFVDHADIKKEFTDMDWESNGKKLINWFINREIPIIILTRPIKEPHTEVCISGKKIWLNKNKLSFLPVIFEREKEKYAGNGNILIDDDSRNIDAWNKAGGMGILYKNDNFHHIIKKLEKLV